MLIYTMHWFRNSWLAVTQVSRAHLTQCAQRKKLNSSRHMHSIHQESLDGPCKWREQVAEFHCSRLGLLSCLCGKATLLPSRAITRKLKMLYQWRFSHLPQEHRNRPLISTHTHRRTHSHTNDEDQLCFITRPRCEHQFSQRGQRTWPVASRLGDR